MQCGTCQVSTCLVEEFSDPEPQTFYLTVKEGFFAVLLAGHICKYNSMPYPPQTLRYVYKYAIVLILDKRE